MHQPRVFGKRTRPLERIVYDMRFHRSPELNVAEDAKEQNDWFEF